MSINVEDEKLKIKNIKTDRERYFNTLQLAATSAALKFLNQRQNMTEELLNEKEEFSVSGFFFDAMVGLALGPLGGLVLKKFTNKLVDSVLGVRYKLLWIHGDKGELKYSLIKNEAGNLLANRDYNFGKSASVIKNVVENKWEDRAAVLWKASHNALNEVVINVGKHQVKEFVDRKTGQSITSGSTNPIDILQALYATTESQKTFEIKLFDFFISQVDKTKHSEEFISTMVEFVTANKTLSDVEMTSMLNFYSKHFELCMWVIYLQDVTRLVGGGTNPSYDAKVKKAYNDKYFRKPSRRGNALFDGPNGKADFSFVKIKRPKLVHYLATKMIHPNSKEGLTIIEHFISEKGKRQGFSPQEIKNKRKALSIFGKDKLTLKSRPHLYKEMVYSELMPVLKLAKNEANKIFANTPL